MGCARLEKEPAPAPPPIVFAEPPEEILCRIDDMTVTVPEFESLWTSFLRQHTLEDESVRAIAKGKFLEQFIEESLIIVYAKQQGIDQDADYQGLLENTRRKLLVGYTLEKTLYSNITVSEDDLTSWYFKNIKEFTIPAKVHVRHILTRTHDEAEQAAERIASGEKFEIVAREMSIHSSRIDGGFLPPFSRGTYDKSFEEVAFQMNVGEISKPVKSDLGYHIIEKVGESPLQLISLNEVHNEIRNKILQQRKQKLYLEFLDKLRNTTQIEIFAK